MVLGHTECPTVIESSSRSRTSNEHMAGASIGNMLFQTTEAGEV